MLRKSKSLFLKKGDKYLVGNIENPTTQIQYIQQSGQKPKPKDIKDLEKELKMEWIEHNEVPMDNLASTTTKASQFTLPPGYVLPPEALAQAIANTQDMTQKVALCNMGLQGHGVFALKSMSHAQCLYTGELYFGSHEIDYVRMFPKGNPYSIPLNDEGPLPEGFLQAAKKGNIGRFIQHAPSKEILDRYYDFESEQVKSSVATANFGFHEMLVRTPENHIMPVKLATNLCPIVKNQQLLVDYGLKYWFQEGNAPDLFTHDGKVLDRSKYYGPLKLGVRLENDTDNVHYIILSGSQRKAFMEDLKNDGEGICVVPFGDNKVYLNIPDLRAALEDRTKCMVRLPGRCQYESSIEQKPVVKPQESAKPKAQPQPVTQPQESAKPKTGTTSLLAQKSFLAMTKSILLDGNANSSLKVYDKVSDETINLSTPTHANVVRTLIGKRA